MAILKLIWAIILSYCLMFSLAFFIISKILQVNVSGNTKGNFHTFSKFPIHMVKRKDRVKEKEMQDDKMRNNMI